MDGVRQEESGSLENVTSESNSSGINLPQRPLSIQATSTPNRHLQPAIHMPNNNLVSGQMPQMADLSLYTHNQMQPTPSNNNPAAANINLNALLQHQQQLMFPTNSMQGHNIFGGMSMDTTSMAQLAAGIMPQQPVVSSNNSLQLQHALLMQQTGGQFPNALHNPYLAAANNSNTPGLGLNSFLTNQLLTNLQLLQQQQNGQFMMPQQQHHQNPFTFNNPQAQAAQQLQPGLQNPNCLQPITAQQQVTVSSSSTTNNTTLPPPPPPPPLPPNEPESPQKLTQSTSSSNLPKSSLSTGGDKSSHHSSSQHIAPVSSKPAPKTNLKPINTSNNVSSSTSQRPPHSKMSHPRGRSNRLNAPASGSSSTDTSPQKLMKSPTRPVKRLLSMNRMRPSATTASPVKVRKLLKVHQMGSSYMKPKTEPKLKTKTTTPNKVVPKPREKAPEPINTQRNRTIVEAHGKTANFKQQKQTNQNEPPIADKADSKLQTSGKDALSLSGPDLSRLPAAYGGPSLEQVKKEPVEQMSCLVKSGKCVQPIKKQNISSDSDKSDNDNDEQWAKETENHWLDFDGVGGSSVSETDEELLKGPQALPELNTHQQLVIDEIYYTKDPSNVANLTSTPKHLSLCRKFSRLRQRLLAARQANDIAEHMPQPLEYNMCNCGGQHSDSDNDKPPKDKTRRRRKKKKKTTQTDAAADQDSESDGGWTSSSSSSSDNNSDVTLNGAHVSNTRYAQAQKQWARKRAHPNALHDLLCYNEPAQLNDAPVCRCSLLAQSSGVRHGQYRGESDKLGHCQLDTNNTQSLHHYTLTVLPNINLKVCYRGGVLYYEAYCYDNDNDTLLI